MWLGQGGHRGSGDMEADVDLEKSMEFSGAEAQGLGSRERYCGAVERTPLPCLPSSWGPLTQASWPPASAPSAPSGWGHAFSLAQPWH